MAISAPTELDHKIVVASASTIVSNAVNFTSGRLYVVAVGGSGATTRSCNSLSGAGGTWTEANGGTDSAYVDGVPWACTLWTATNATGSAQALTAGFTAAWANHQFIHIFEIVAGFDTSGLVVQSVAGNQAPTATQATCNLANSGAAGNMRLGYFVHRLQEAFTAANGGTLGGHQQAASPTSVKALWYLDSSTTADPSVTWATNTRGAVYMGIEIKATAGGAQALAATIAGTSTVTADLSATHPLAATIAAVSTATADLASGKLLNATVTATSSVVADLGVSHPLAATVTNLSTVAANLGIARPLAATIASVSALTAALTVGKDLAAAVAGQSTVTADLRLTHPVAATITVVSTVTADLGATPPISLLGIHFTCPSLTPRWAVDVPAARWDTTRQQLTQRWEGGLERPRWTVGPPRKEAS